MAQRDETAPRVTLGIPQGETALRLDFEQIQSILPALIDALADAVVVVDRSRRVVAANRRYVEAFGTARARVQGMVCHDVLSCPESHGTGACAACDVMAHGRSMHVVRNVPAGPGEVRRWEATFTPIVDAEGTVTHVVEVWRDITDRSRLESQISHNERLASLGILAAGVGHEINNPLASMLAGVESLTRMIGRGEFGPESRQEAEELLGLIEREIIRSRGAVDKLMLLAQPVSSAPTDVDLNRVVKDTLSLLSFQNRRQGVAVVERLAEGLPTIWGRDSGIRGVCMNLMMNAMQAMSTGGTMTVATSRWTGGISLVVEDTGPGIAKDLLERIWDPFFTTKPSGKGTGLGLAITHRIVHRHGGTIRVESEPGRGARFIVELPADGPGGIDA